MEAAVLTGPEAWLQQRSPALRGKSPKTPLQVMKATQEGETSKATGEVEQAEGEAMAPPEENPPAPIPTDPKPGTRQDPTDTPAVDPTQVPAVDPTQANAQDPDQDTPLS